MDYLSTRGQAPVLDFESVVLAGLASDGGLYVPASIPTFSPAEIAAMQGDDYETLAYKIMSPFMGGSVPEVDLKQIIHESYAGFRHQAIAPLKQIAPQQWLLELFHGPTLAFKDFALQFLGRLVDYFLARRDERVVVLGATSGDTGSAALAGCAGRDRMQSVILFPDGRVSQVQRRQMTTQLADNIHNLSVKGTFDDCQDMVKTLFADADFRAEHRLVAVNSINWARIMAQIVYYFYAALRLGAPANSVHFSVPTGNFGDIFAGYIARQMGLPMGKLVIATNRNDILYRCLQSGHYQQDGVTPSLSPSMDIQISSNFERLLFDLHQRDGALIRQMMQQFRADKTLSLHPAARARLQQLFAAARADDETTLQVMAQCYQQSGELLDPHTAVGVHAANACLPAGEPAVILATAHPAKFPDAVKKATNIHPPLPDFLADLHQREERFQPIDNQADAVRDYIRKHCQ